MLSLNAATLKRKAGLHAGVSVEHRLHAARKNTLYWLFQRRKHEYQSLICEASRSCGATAAKGIS
jgi:hypothetical protein